MPSSPDHLIVPSRLRSFLLRLPLVLASMYTVGLAVVPVLFAEDLVGVLCVLLVSDLLAALDPCLRSPPWPPSCYYFV